MPEINEADKEALTAALVVLQRKGVPSDTLEMLTHGDNRGTIAPGALNEAIRAALRAPSPIGLADDEVELAMILRPFMECCEQFCPCATPHKGCQCMNAAVAISAHLHAQRKASDVRAQQLLGHVTADPRLMQQLEHMASLQTCAAGGVPDGTAIAALREIAFGNYSAPDIDGAAAETYAKIVDRMQDVAREALSASPSPPELHRESQTVGGESGADASSLKTSQAIASGDEGGV
jgi:hypothetical protein